MKPGEWLTDLDFLFIRIADRHYRVFLERTDSLSGFNPAVHGPKSFKMNIECQFYIANPFRVYNVEDHNHRSGSEEANFSGDFPEKNHVYITFHLRGVYSSPLRYHSLG